MGTSDVNPSPRVYLDHAATSWPKSEAVLAAMDRYARDCGAAAGRGGYASATQADAVISTTRQAIAELVQAESSRCISFHANGTAALNAAIHGVLRPGDHVVTTAAEHNSVLRPLHHWQHRHGVKLTIVPTDKNGLVDADELLAAVRDETRLVTLTSASNVTGTEQPVQTVGHGLLDHPAIFLCDAAQTFGCLPIDVRAAGIDLLAAPGHKSSGGPLGTGFLYVAEKFHDEIASSVQGGTGSQSESLDMPRMMPNAMEAGNLNVPALAGWVEALRALQLIGLDAKIEHHAMIADRLHASIGSIDRVRIFGRAGRVPIASIAVEGYSPNDVAIILDTEFGIETRAGLHCAALIHRCIESGPEGTLRISGGPTTTCEEIDAVASALHKIANS